MEEHSVQEQSILSLQRSLLSDGSCIDLPHDTHSHQSSPMIHDQIVICVLCRSLREKQVWSTSLHSLSGSVAFVPRNESISSLDDWRQQSFVHSLSVESEHTFVSFSRLLVVDSNDAKNTFSFTIEVTDTSLYPHCEIMSIRVSLLFYGNERTSESSSTLDVMLRTEPNFNKNRHRFTHSRLSTGIDATQKARSPFLWSSTRILSATDFPREQEHRWTVQSLVYVFFLASRARPVPVLQRLDRYPHSTSGCPWWWRTWQPQTWQWLRHSQTISRRSVGERSLQRWFDNRDPNNCQSDNDTCKCPALFHIGRGSCKEHCDNDRFSSRIS